MEVKRLHHSLFPKRLLPQRSVFQRLDRNLRESDNMRNVKIKILFTDREGTGFSIHNCYIRAEENPDKIIREQRNYQQ